MTQEVLHTGHSPQSLGLAIQTISVDLTERCPLRCSYCFAHPDKAIASSALHDLTVERGKEIIDWFLSDEVSGPSTEGHKLRIEWWGGEPFLKFDLMQELTTYADSQAQKAGKSIMFGGTTNVVLITREILEWLIPRDIHFLLSIDGRNERNACRQFPDGTNAWETIRERLDTIVEVYREYDKKLPSIRMTPSPGNIAGMAEDIRFFYDMGFHTIFFSENYDVVWSEEDYAAYEQELRKIADLRIETAELKADFLQSKFMDDMSRFLIQAGVDGIPTLTQRKGRACGAGNTFLGVGVDGRLYICHRANKHTGDASDAPAGYIGSIYEGITRPEFLEYMETIKIPQVLGDASPLSQCGDCDLAMLCLGGCYMVRQDVLGDMNKPLDTICRIKHIFKHVALYEVTQALVRRVFRVYLSNVGVKGLLGWSHGSPSCACNMSTYTSTPELIEAAMLSGQFSGAENIRDNASMLVTVRGLIDRDLAAMTKGAPLNGCVCNSGTYNRDRVVEHTGITDEQYLKLVDLFHMYWDEKLNV